MDLINRLNDTGLPVPEEDMDFLLEVAGTARKLIREKDNSVMCSLISALVKRSLFESLSWVLEILQEEYSRGEKGSFPDMVCDLGGSIPDYDRFISTLRADMHVIKNEVMTIPDENGETKAFYNDLTYRTGFKNIFLVSSENFDNRDNDYIRYSIVFSGDDILQNDPDGNS